MLLSASEPPRGFNNRVEWTAEEMALHIGPNKSRFVAFTAVFTAMIVVLDVIPHGGFYAGIWDSWMFLIIGTEDLKGLHSLVVGEFLFNKHTSCNLTII